MCADAIAETECACGWNYEKSGNYLLAMEHYLKGISYGSLIARERAGYLSDLGDGIYDSTDGMGEVWFNYDTIAGNLQYTHRYYPYYDTKNRRIFEYLFWRYFKNKQSIRIAIVGGGNGWELDAIYDLLETKFTNLRVECTIIDPIEWPLAHTGMYRTCGHVVRQIYKKIGSHYGELDPASLVGYDLVYFARCINYTDSRDMNLEWLKSRTQILRRTTLVAFDQIELERDSKRYRTHDFQKEFESVFRCAAIKCNNVHLYNEGLYVMGVR